MQAVSGTPPECQGLCTTVSSQLLKPASIAKRTWALLQLPLCYNVAALTGGPQARCALPRSV